VIDESDISEHVARLQRAAEEKQRRAPGGPGDAGSAEGEARPARRNRRADEAIEHIGASVEAQVPRRSDTRWLFQVAIREDRTLTSTQRLVALIYALHAHADGSSAYPSAARVAACCGLAKSTVKNIRGQLVQLGWLVELERRQGMTTKYGLSIPEGVSEEDHLVSEGVSQEDLLAAEGVLDEDAPVASEDLGVSEKSGGVQVEDPKLKEVETEAGSEDPPSAGDEVDNPGAHDELPRWEAVRRDECVGCDQLRLVSGDGLCQACIEGRAAA
jgi:hypothetical protein